MTKLILRNHQSPGDVMAMTAAVENLFRVYPGKFEVDVRTTAWEIWENNPHITPIASDDPDAQVIDCQYPLIHHCNGQAVHMIDAFVQHLAEQIKHPMRCVVNRPFVYLSTDEQSWVDQVAQNFAYGRKVPFWIVNAGAKNDFPAKQWPVEHFQAVIDQTRGRITWVQVGASEHDHPDLAGVIDLRGKTDTRQLIRLVYHSRGGIGPLSFLMHLAAALEKPYIAIGGGREPVQWNAYPKQHLLHSIGSLPCCERGACWRSKVIPQAGESTCERPIYGLKKPVAECMARIRPSEVVSILERYECAC